jgi:hypothetical protein
MEFRIMFPRITIALLFSALIAGQAVAQTAEETDVFDNLSTGNQKIAQSLFDAQPRDEFGDPVEGSLTHDEIAARKKNGTGWGELFRDMRSEGYIDSDARNLGQLVSGKYQAPIVGSAPIPTPLPSSSTSDTVGVTDSGAFATLSPGNRKIAQSLYDSQPQDEFGDPVEGSLTRDEIAELKRDGTGWGELFRDMRADGYIEPDAKNLGQLVSGKYQAPIVDGEPTPTPLPSTTVGENGGATDSGAFNTLSPGNRKIAQSLFDGQPRDEFGDPVEGSLTRDEIAEMKQDGAGWGEMFKDMRTEGHIESDAKNLGQLVSGKYQSPIVDGEPTPTTTTNSTATTVAAANRHSPVVVTTANGGQMVVGGGRGHKSGHDGTYAQRGNGNGHGRGGQDVAITSGDGNTGSLNHGQSKKLSLTSAGGNAVGSNGGHGVSNGNGHGGGVLVSNAGGGSNGGGGLAAHGGGRGNGSNGKALGKSK